MNHEIVHILLGRAFGHRPVPHWLQEGVAQIVSGEYNEQTMETLGWGKVGQGWYTLQEISRGFPSNAARAKLAYAESAYRWFLLETYGVDTLQEVIAHMAHGYSFPLQSKIRREKGCSMDLEWREDPKLSLLWLKPLTSDTTILAVFAILFVGKLYVQLSDDGKKCNSGKKMSKFKRHWQKCFKIGIQFLSEKHFDH